jgi:hypothetical protein
MCRMNLICIRVRLSPDARIFELDPYRALEMGKGAAFEKD